MGQAATTRTATRRIKASIDCRLESLPTRSELRTASCAASGAANPLPDYAAACASCVKHGSQFAGQTTGVAVQPSVFLNVSTPPFLLRQLLKKAFSRPRFSSFVFSDLALF